MSDSFFQWIETQGSQGLFLAIYLLLMALFFYFRGWQPLSQMKGKITRSGKALEGLRRWKKNHPEFIAGKYSREANAPSDSNLNPRTQQWLKLLWAGHLQNKPPVVDEVLQREEEYLCGDDETIRTTSGSLIALGLLGTFIGLYQVILPIKGIIQNTRDNATITDPSVATQSMANMLENIDQSFSGMGFAFVTSIAGLLGMIVLNIRFSLLNKKRFELIDEIETYCNEEIAPKFRLFLPEVDLKEAVQEAFQVLADRHSEFMADQSDYLKTTLEAHFKKVSESFEPFLETLNNTSDMLNKASISNEQVSEKWGSTLEDFSHRHSRLMTDQEKHIKRALETHFEKISASLGPLLETLNNACDALNSGAEDIRESGENFVEHISNFTRLSEPLEKLKVATEKMVEDFDERMETLALTMGETYQVLQKLNPDEPTYKPVFDNIKAQLGAIHATEQDLLKFHQEWSDKDDTGVDEKVGSLLEGLSDVKSAVERLDKTLVENLIGVNQTLNDLPEVVSQQKQIIRSVQNIGDRRRSGYGRPPIWFKRFIDKLKRFFSRWDRK